MHLIIVGNKPIRHGLLPTTVLHLQKDFIDRTLNVTVAGSER